MTYNAGIKPSIGVDEMRSHPEQSASVENVTLAGEDQSPIGRVAESDTVRYKARLYRWAIARIHNHQQEIVARFRSRSDADGHLQLLRQRDRAGTLVIVAIRPEQ